jgi:hypothetical protein
VLLWYGGAEIWVEILPEDFISQVGTEIPACLGMIVGNNKREE